MSDHRQDYQSWLRLAKEDLAAARDLARTGHHALACFHCQQAAEKGLKALLYQLGHDRVATHSVHALAELCGRHYPKITDRSSDLRQLDAYYLAPRYPNGVPVEAQDVIYTPHHSEDAIHIAGNTLDLIEQLTKRDDKKD